jgi:H+/Cl- antiporter ClcA
MNSDTGKWMIAAGALLLLAGILVYFFHDKLSWLGRLPGDIRIENEDSRFYFPIVTSILLSVLFSAALYLYRKFF